MIRKLKTIGLVLVAAFALSAVAAAAAQAEAPEFHGEEGPVTYVGEQLESATFTGTGGAVKCTKGTWEGSSSTTTTTEIEFEATSGGCTALGLPVVWDFNGCTYPSRMVLGSSPPTTVTDIKCPAGKEVTITIGKICVVHVPPQKGIKHVVWDNVGSGRTRDFKATMTEEGITYTETTGCPFPGTYKNGTYFATVTVKGRNSKGEQQGIWAE
jgi:hypothetical protein